MMPNVPPKKASQKLDALYATILYECRTLNFNQIDPNLLY